MNKFVEKKLIIMQISQKVPSLGTFRWSYQVVCDENDLNAIN